MAVSGYEIDPCNGSSTAQIGSPNCSVAQLPDSGRSMLPNTHAQ